MYCILFSVLISPICLWKQIVLKLIFILDQRCCILYLRRISKSVYALCADERTRTKFLLYGGNDYQEEGGLGDYIDPSIVPDFLGGPCEVLKFTVVLFNDESISMSRILSAMITNLTWCQRFCKHRILFVEYVVFVLKYRAEYSALFYFATARKYRHR